MNVLRSEVIHTMKETIKFSSYYVQAERFIEHFYHDEISTKFAMLSTPGGSDSNEL